MLVGEFTDNASGHMTQVKETGVALEIQNYRKDHVTVIPTELWRAAEPLLREHRADLLGDSGTSR